MNFKDIKKYTSNGHYQVNSPWRHFEEFYLNEKDKYHYFNINPDYQRGHVWTSEQESKYIEHILRGGQQGKDLYFNCPGWMNNYQGPAEVVDGKQRIKAVLGFLHDTVKAFGYYCSEFESPYVGHLPSECEFIVHINDLPKRWMVLQWYLEMNAGMTIHTDEELNKVKILIEQEKNK